MTVAAERPAARPQGQRPDPRTDPGPRAAAVAVSLALHVGVAVAVLWGPATPPAPLVVEDPILVTDFLELPRLGEERPENMLPRIVQAPLPEPAAAAPVNLNQEREEEEEKAVEKQPDPEERESDQPPDPEAQKREEEEARKRRQKEMAAAMAKLDPRADEDSPEGFANGYAEGTGNRAAQAREEELWMLQVRARMKDHLEPPASISPGECRHLATIIHIVLNGAGKVTNEVKIGQTSGNGFFDDAALRAVRFFTEDGEGVLPLPRADRLPALRKEIMKAGRDLQLECAQ